MTMQEFFTPYGPAILAMGCMGFVLLIQLLVADLTGLRARHVPGSQVEADHRSFFFRATRAHANTNESIASFVLMTLFCLLVGVPSFWLNWLAWGYVASRLGHMACYYGDLRLLRSVSFGLALASLFGMFLLGLWVWLA